MALPFSPLCRDKIAGMGYSNRNNIGILKSALIASYDEIERLLAVIGNVSYLILIFLKLILMTFLL